MYAIRSYYANPRCNRSSGSIWVNAASGGPVVLSDKRSPRPPTRGYRYAESRQWYDGHAAARGSGLDTGSARLDRARNTDAVDI